MYSGTGGGGKTFQLVHVPSVHMHIIVIHV